MTAIEELKAQLRNVANKRVESFITTNTRIESDYKIVKSIRNFEIYKKAKTVLTFYPSQNEPVITDIFKDPGKTFYFPKISGDGLTVGTGRLAIGKFGIYEPIITSDTRDFDLMLIPGNAFDIHFNRLGRGKGYFDKFLKTATGFKLGIGYDVQVFASVPVEPHDVKMDGVLTEKRIMR